MEDLRGTRADGRKRAREDEVLDQLDPIESAEVKRLREDLLLGFFDDTDPKPFAQDLDSVMRSFQEEISNAAAPATEEVVDLTLESGESWSKELGYLSGASDDDLGLPPYLRNDVVDDVWSRDSELAGAQYGWAWGLDGYDDGMGGIWDGPSYGCYDGDEGYEYVASSNGGLFEYSDVCFDPSDDVSDALPTQ